MIGAAVFVATLIGTPSRDRRGIALDPVPERPPGEGLQDLISPALGLLDRGAALGVAGKKRRLGSKPVELARDLDRALDPVPVES